MSIRRTHGIGPEIVATEATLIGTSELEARDMAAAARTVRAHARDEDDRAMLLAVLGLTAYDRTRGNRS
ncbi:MAG TPA: hypothetical protein VK698_39600 [Kofleriaceae bacterium]|nr:hypothetical protein [Kofleriaceae bacterium]